VVTVVTGGGRGVLGSENHVPQSLSSSSLSPAPGGRWRGGVAGCGLVWALRLVDARTETCEESCEASGEAADPSVSCGGVGDVGQVGGGPEDRCQGAVVFDVGGCVGCWCWDGDGGDQQGVACCVAGVGGRRRR